VAFSVRSLLAAGLAALALSSSTAPCRAAESEDEAGEAKSEAKESEGDTGDAAKKPAEAEAAPKEESKPEAFGHGRQFGLRAGMVLGYRMVLRYDNSPYCAEPKPAKQPKDQQKFCGYPAPLSVDLGLSFGVADFLEPFVWARFGLSADTHSDTNPLVLIGAGVRLYTMSDAAFKIFIEPAVALELESSRGTPAWQLGSPEYKKDFVFHLAAGPQLDFHPNFGAYLTGGVSMGVVRALASTLDLNIGVQGRY
jgi:opacity protein-like surface antigen